MPRVFIFLSCMVAISTAYHLYGLIVPSIQEAYPWQRHLFWIVFNSIGIYFLLNRRWYLIPIIAALVMQQWHGHGGALIYAWIEENRISFTDLFPMINILLIFLAYTYDIYKSKLEI